MFFFAFLLRTRAAHATRQRSAFVQHNIATRECSEMKTIKGPVVQNTLVIIMGSLLSSCTHVAATRDKSWYDDKPRWFCPASVLPGKKRHYRSKTRLASSIDSRDKGAPSSAVSGTIPAQMSGRAHPINHLSAAHEEVLV